MSIIKETPPSIMIGRIATGEKAERRNAYWAELGKKYGFNDKTVKACPKGGQYFIAEPIS